MAYISFHHPLRRREVSEKGSAVLDAILDHLKINERQYFGLRFMDRHGQVHWLDTSKSLRKQLRRCSTPYIFYFCVKYYHPEPALLEEELTRYQFFLQLKSDIRNDLLPAPFPVLAELGAYSLQSDIGSYVRAKHKPGYASEFANSNFAPDPTDGLVAAIEAKHQALQGQSAAVVECCFLDRASQLPFYGVDKYPVLPDVSSDTGSCFIGFSPAGVVLIKNDRIWDECAWAIILKITKDVDLIWPPSGRSRAGTIRIHFRAKDGTYKSFGFHLATKEAFKHLYSTAVDHMTYHQRLRGEEVHSPSLSSRIVRFGYRFRSSSHADCDSESTSAGTAVESHGRRTEGHHRFDSKFERQPSRSLIRVPRQRIPSSVINEDEAMPMMRSEYSTVPRRQVVREISAETDLDGLSELRRAPITTTPRMHMGRRSVSPMSLLSSFSTCPPRLSIPTRIAELDNDNDSVFSGSSRMTCDDTLSRSTKRKRSAIGENNSSGASDETGPINSIPVNGALRASLGPQRRRGKMAVRNKTHDGSSIKEAMLQLSARSAHHGNPFGCDRSLPDHLAALMQPAKSMTMLNSVRPKLAIAVPPALGKSMGQLNSGVPSSPVNLKDPHDGRFRSVFPFHPPGSIDLNSNTSNPPFTPSAKLKSFEFKFGNPPAPAPPNRDLQMPVSASWTAGDRAKEHCQAEILAASPIKSKSFDFKIDLPKVTVAIEEPPKHVRSHSTSSPVSATRKMSTRARLQSDSGFQPLDRARKYEEVDKVPVRDSCLPSGADSPLLSPFLVIPPPTPFSEETYASSAPPVSPRSPGAISVSRLTAKRLGLSGGPPNRSDSFITALKCSDMELQPMRSVVEQKNLPSSEEPVYSTLPSDVSLSARLKVEADVHGLPSGFYDVPSRDKPTRMSNGSLSRNKPIANPPIQPFQVSTVHNQMYLEMPSNGGKDSPVGLSSKIQPSRKAGNPVRPIALHVAQTPAQGAFSNRHPLETVHSTQSDSQLEWSRPPTQILTNGTCSSPPSLSSQASPTDENDPTVGLRRISTSTRQVYPIVTRNDDFPMYTDI